MTNREYPRHESPHYGRREDFGGAIRNTGSPSAASALDALDATLWLLAGGMVAQALFLAHHTVEIALKGLLEEISVLLTIDRLEYDLAKGLARERVSTHRLGRLITKFADPEQYDPDRTCGLLDAYSRVQEMVSFSAVNKRQVESLNKLRNEIVHHGGLPQNDLNYLDAVLNVSLPLLEEFYAKGYGLIIQDWILSPRFRELAIARDYIVLCKENPGLPRTRILHTFQRRYFAEAVVGVGNLLFTASGEQRDVDQWLDNLNREARLEAEKRGWDIIGETADTSCVICGANNCIVAIGPQPRIEDGCDVYDPVALHCPACDLLIEPTHSELARLHYGTISEDRLGPEAWANEVPR